MAVRLADEVGAQINHSALSAWLCHRVWTFKKTAHTSAGARRPHGTAPDMVVGQPDLNRRFSCSVMTLGFRPRWRAYADGPTWRTPPPPHAAPHPADRTQPVQAVAEVIRAERPDALDAALAEKRAM